MFMQNQQEIRIAYIGGGSRGWAWGLMKDLALESQLTGTVKLYDIDFNAALDNEKIGNRIKENPNSIGNWEYKAVHTLKEALVDADFVIISILPGTFKEMASDVHEPETYGIFQSVGDTVGPGGLVRALRAIPMFKEFAEHIKLYAPHAWVINYTNPMSLCTKTLYEVFPSIKAVGCCHEVFDTQELLALMLEEMKGITGISRADIQVNVLGINHFTWIDKASFKNIDLMALYKTFSEKYRKQGYDKGSDKEHWMNSHFHSAYRIQFDLYTKYGLIPCAGDRHLAEFMPRNWYLHDKESIKKWKFHLTPVEWRIQNKNELLEKSRKLVSGEEQLPLNKSGEEGVEMIKALLGMGNLLINVNLPNQGQMRDLPMGAIVETNAVLSFDEIKPVIAGELPIDIRNLVTRHLLNQEAILKAGIEKDKELALKAFMNDPLVSLNPDAAEKLLNSMLQNTKDFLKGWNL